VTHSSSFEHGRPLDNVSFYTANINEMCAHDNKKTKGNRVARVESSNHAELEEVLQRYQFMNSKLDLFSEKADNAWGDREAKDMTKTPRTTARFIPGYDWGSAKGFFDEAGEKAVQSFEDTFENWIPDIEDEDDKNNSSKK